MSVVLLLGDDMLDQQHLRDLRAAINAIPEARDIGPINIYNSTVTVYQFPPPQRPDPAEPEPNA